MDTPSTRETGKRKPNVEFQILSCLSAFTNGFALVCESPIGSASCAAAW
ncbi:unnamed protein product [Brassica oleracea]|uniref:(rape) hypothetical protein n=1 Tax=Brassica napus TaxID=3708 RepID=A0A816KPQ1_BRANA|nr:unnamed protein product [Brassica napus]